ncbi:MAG: hypothetical protein K1X28_10120 [Parachlamydiales bacterium]|nr:hypothetical protein [Parachlamydiales bacterium]
MLAVRSSEIHLTGPTENLSLEKVAQVVASLDVFAEKIIEKRNAVALIDEDLNRNAYPTLFTDSMFCQIRNIDREIFLAYIRMYEICRKAGIGVGFWVL